MKRMLSTSLLTLMISISMMAFIVQGTTSLEPLATEWDRTYGGTSSDEGYSMIEASDGGYLLTGRTDSYGAGNWDIWLVKTDAVGIKEWDETYGGTGQDVAHQVIETSDGGYAIAGYTESKGAGGADFWLIKTDSTGVEEWNQTYGGAHNDYGESLVESIDGGYVIAGYTGSFGAGGNDLWLIKTNSTGGMEWNQTIGGNDHDNAQFIIQTADGGYAIAGYTESYGAGWRNAWLVKTDSAGNHQWNKTYGGTGEDGGRSLVEAGDGGFAIAGFTISYGAGNKDFWLIKTDDSGIVEWDETYGGTGEDQAFSLVKTDDGGYALAGYTASKGAGGWDFWLVKTDVDGNMEWDQPYGGTSTDLGMSVIQTSDGGYAVAGFTGSYGAGNNDFWLVKLAPESKPVHNINTGLDYAEIQDAIDAPETLDGHTILVDAGTYYEHVVVDKSLSLVGEDRSTTIIDGSGTGSVVTIATDGVTITGFKIQNSGVDLEIRGGIYISYSSETNISCNILTNNNHGIRGYGVTSSIISGNTIIDNSYHGVDLETSDHNTVSANTLASNVVGVKLEVHSNDNIVYGNSMTDNMEEGVEIDIYSNYNTVTGNSITGNNRHGVQLWRSSFNSISQNTITDNGQSGVWFDHGSDHNNLFENLIANHTVGIEFSYGGSYNKLYHNNFINNTHQALPDPGDINSWDDGYPSGGNYWSDYEERYPLAEELDGSGIWNTPYVIDGNNQDNYPLMNPWGVHEYRKMIMIDNTRNPDTLADYQVFVNVTYDPNMQTDFDDLRFAWYNETSGEQVGIDYWLDTYVDSEYALVWVEVPEIRGSGEEVLYMYYHNPYAVSESNGEETFVFFDGFSTDTTANYQIWSPVHGNANPNEFSWDPNGWLFVNASIRERPGRNSNVHVHHKTAVMDPTEDQYWLETRCKAFGDGWLDYLGTCNLFKRDSMPQDVYFRMATVAQGIRDQIPMNRCSLSVGWGSWECGNRSDLPMPVIGPWFRIGLGTASDGTVVGSYRDDDYGELATLICHTVHQDVKWWVDLVISRILTDDWATMHAYFDYVRVRKFADPEPTAVSAEDYIDNVDETIQDLPDEIFDEASEDVPDIKNDFSDLFSDALENIEEGNYEGAVEKLNRIKEKIYEEIVESAERQELISMIDSLIASIEPLL